MLKYIPAILRILLGAIFIFSAISKLFPIEIFELNFVYSGFINWAMAPWLARILIALEFMLGFSLLFNIKLRFFSIPASLLLLVFFTIYLFYSLIVDGNEGNCGCFGTLLPMTPIESIIKNVVIIGLLIFIYKKHNTRNMPRFVKWVPPGVFILSFVLLLIVWPITSNTKIQKKSIVNEKANFLDYTGFVGDNDVDLEKGRHLIAFLSLGCDHCKEVAMKIGIMKKRANLPDVYYFLLGKETKLDKFFNDTKAKFPYKVLELKEFLDICGSSVPRVILIDEGIIKAEWYNKDFNPETVQQFFSKKVE